MSRLLMRLTTAAAVIGAAVLAPAAPAAAGPPEFRDLCAAVQVLFDALPPNARIEVARDGQLVSETTGPESGNLFSLDIGAADGDQLVVTVEGEVAGEWVHDDPADCASVPLSMSVERSCGGLALLHVNNAGSEPLSVRPVVFRDPGDPVTSQEIAIPPGEASLPLSLSASATHFRLELRGPVNSFRTWIRLGYSNPEECGTDAVGAVGATFTDDCDQVRVNITSGIEPPQPYDVIRESGDGASRESGVVRASTPGEHTLTARTGDAFAVSVSVSEDPGVFGETRVVEHTYTTPASCGGGGTGGAGESGGGEGGSGGGLPITGLSTGAVVAGGLVLLAAGAGLVMAGRRRRIRFSSSR
jgi:hypothetical protein